MPGRMIFNRADSGRHHAKARFDRARHDAASIAIAVEQRRQAKLRLAEQFAQRQRAAGQMTTVEMAIALAEPDDVTTQSKDK